MAFDLHLSIPENTPRWKAVQQVAAEQHITPEQAAERIFDEATRAKLLGKKTPAQEMLGAFSSPEDVALMDEVMEIVHARRAADVPRDFGL